MNANPSNVWKFQHQPTKEVYFMRFGPPSTRFIRDDEPPSSVFTNHGRPRQVSISYPAETAGQTPPDPVQWDPDTGRPDWAYTQRRQFEEVE
ncbi:MAG TPA: hypothetical protein VNL71_02010 [Chloroflexota bacterium]|nr:hypothetical protein [Chloroflexota bacterium]